MIWYGLLGLFIVLTVLILWSQLHIDMNVNVEQQTKIQFRLSGLYGLFQYRYERPNSNDHEQDSNEKPAQDSSKKTAENNSEEKAKVETKVGFSSKTSTKRNKGGLVQQGKVLLSQLVHHTERLKRILSNVKCQEFRWITKIGVGDAAETAVIVGMGWATVMAVTGSLFHLIQLKATPELAVYPVYQHSKLSSEVTCKLTVRLFHVSTALFLISIIMFKGKLWVKLRRKMVTKTT